MKNEWNREILHFGRKTKFTILYEIWMQIRNFDKILDEIGDFGRTKNDSLDKIFRVSPNILVAQYKVNADIKLFNEISLP